MKARKHAHQVLRRVVDRSLRSQRVSGMVWKSDLLRGSMLFRDLGDHCLVFDPAETVGRRVLTTGDFNRAATQEVVEKAAGGGPGGVMIEIGANIGTQTVYAALAHDFERVIAVEPDSRNLKLLQANVRLNGLTHRVEVVRCAVSSASGTLELTRTVHNSGASTVERLAGGPLAEGVSSERVPARRGDELLAELGVRPGDVRLVWIDVEGHEASVLEGMPELLGSRPPLYFEYSASRLAPAQRAVVCRVVFEVYERAYLHRRGAFEELSRDDFERLPGVPGHVDLLLM
jgi:FkbM family methyltransferase